jgi:hypothetical protein
MLEMDIAGRKIFYRNVGELNAKLVALLDAVHKKRVVAEEAYESLKKQEESLRRLLGGCLPVEDSATISGKATDGR